jgi:hypothetical protein
MQRNSGSTDVTATQLGYTLETADSLRFAGKTITVSFWARAGANYSGTSNALYYVLATGTGTDQRLLGSGFTGTAYSVVSLVTLTTSWQRFSYTTTVPSTATEISHYFQANLNAGTAGANDYWDVTGVQLEEGAVATPFEFEDFGTTLAKCQRYYWRSATGLTTDANSRHAHFRRLNGYTMIATGHCAFPVTMRAEPTVALYNGNGVGFVDGYGNGQESYVIASGEGLSVYGIGILVKYTNSGLATTAAFNADPANISYWANIEASAEL